MSNRKMMTLTVIGLDVFATEITCEGKLMQIEMIGIGDTFEELYRCQSLLKDLCMNHLDRKTLNSIGMSDEDLLNIGIHTDDKLNLLKMPPRAEWYAE